MTIELVGKVRSTLKSTDHPYMQGAWKPTFNEWNAIFANGDAEVIGTIPDDIDGVYVRTGEVPVHEPIGRYHPFDGDPGPLVAGDGGMDGRGVVTAERSRVDAGEPCEHPDRLGVG